MSVAYDWDVQVHQQQQQQQQYTVNGHVTPESCKGGKRSRQTYSKYQTAVLETVFQTSKYIVRSKRQQMSAELSLTERQIKIWFQNRRMKEKKCHKEVPRIDDRQHSTIGYADDYSAESAAGAYLTPPTNDNLRDETFVNNYHLPAAKNQLDGGGYAGYEDASGYDLLTPEPDPFKQQWPPVAVDFHQDFYVDHDLGHFQRIPMAHHHRPLNPQVPDYCPPHLQAAHGY